MADIPNTPEQEIVIINQTSPTEQKTTIIEVIPGEASTSVVGEIIEAILDPLHTHDTTTGDAAGSVVIIEEHVVSDDASLHVAPADDPAAPHPEEAAPAHSESDSQHDTAGATEAGSASDHPSEHDAQAEAATADQAAADDAVAHGDYESASHLRESAEDHSSQAKDDNMLHGATSGELQNAADHQQHADALEHQEAQHAQEGNYEAARDDAFNATWEHHGADSAAQGSDHSGQAQAEHSQMDWAVFEGGIAHDNAQSAEAYAAEGDHTKAEMYAEHAAEHQAASDEHGELGEHDGHMAVSDPSSEVHHDDSGATHADTGHDSLSDSSHTTENDHSSDTSSDHP
jgi:hypothetical protein